MNETDQESDGAADRQAAAQGLERDGGPLRLLSGPWFSHQRGAERSGQRAQPVRRHGKADAHQQDKTEGVRIEHLIDSLGT